jgi:hypothetical protein
MEQAEQAFLDVLDARDAAAFIESGRVESFEGRDLVGWARYGNEERRVLDAGLKELQPGTLSSADAQAVAAMRRSLASLDDERAATGDAERVCVDARRPDLDYPGLRSALESCYAEIGNRLQYSGSTIDRGTALELLHDVPDAAQRRALFEAFVPLWVALNGSNQADSPYRRLVAMAARDAAGGGSEIDAAARAIGVSANDVEQWLVELLDAWREASPAQPVEPWDYRYRNSVGTRALAAQVPAAGLLPLTLRYYRDLGADLRGLGVVFDLAPRPDKSPLAYTDFLARGRARHGQWQRSTARVVGTYPAGGLFSLNELVHESGHAAHVSAIRNRPAYMDWPDTLFTEAFADVPSWSIYEPVWQQKYLGTSVEAAASLRAMLSDVMLDVAWSLFELRLLRDPETDPNLLWTGITHRYLNVIPHPEMPWWAMRVQLVGNPGYMVNYGLGAVLTADMRARTAELAGPFDTGNEAWYAWLSERLLRFGSERDTRSLLQDFLGRPPSPDALLRQIRRCTVR